MKFQHAYYTEKSRHEPSGPRGQIWVYGMQPPAWRAWDGALHMHQMHTLLKAMGLVAYKDRFEEMGYDDVRFLRYMSEEQVEYMLAGVGMKISHAIRFRWLEHVYRQTKKKWIPTTCILTHCLDSNAV